MAGVAVPQFGDDGFSFGFFKFVPEFFQQEAGIVANKYADASFFREGYGPFCGVTEGYAEFPQDGGFFLESTAVGDDHPGSHTGFQHIEVSQGIQQDEVSY